MKKIVINNCFGGFSLSDEAYELYLKMKGIRYYKEPSSYRFSFYYAVPSKKYKELKEKWIISSRDIERDDHVLIKVVQKLKRKANGACARLKIVEIPDYVEWTIEKYDGLEHVAEKHRVWR